MASGDDSPSSLHGQPWSVWAEKLGRDSPQSDEDEARKTGRRQGDTMKLQSEDMCYYGLCPVRDDFYLVVCNICNKVCTPQALQKHIETRHPPSPLPAVPEATPVSALTGGPAPPSRSKGKKNASSANPVSSASSSSKPVPDIMATKAPPASCRPRKDRHKERSNAKLPTSIPFEPPLPPPVKPPSLPPSPLFSTPPSPTPAPATCLSNITMTVNLDSSGVPTVQIHLPETEEGNSLLNDVDLLDNSVAVATDLIGTKGTSKKRKNSKTDRKCLPLKDREFDPEKHCGVWMPENGRPCTRSLTCKAHSLSLRRAVTGRSKAFDDLLATHRAAKETFGKQNNGSIPSAPTSSVASTTVLPSSSSNSSAATFTMTSPKFLKVQKVTTPKLQSHPHSLIKPSSTTLPPLHVQTSGEASDCKFSSPQATHSPLLIPMGAQERSSSPIHTTSAPPQPLASCTFGLKSCGSLWMRGPSSRSWNTIRNSLKSTFSHQPAPSQYTMSNGVLHEGKRHAELVSEDLPAEFEWKNKRWKPESNFAELESEFMPSYTNGLHLSPDPLLDPFDGLEMLEGLVGEDGVLTSDIMNFPLGFNLGLGPGGNVTFSDSGGSGGGNVLGPALTKNSMGAPAYLTTPSASGLTPTGAMAPISFAQSLGHQVFSEASSTASQELTFKWMANSPSVSGPSSSSGHVRSSQGAGPNSHAHLQLLLQSDTEHT